MNALFSALMSLLGGSSGATAAGSAASGAAGSAGAAAAGSALGEAAGSTLAQGAAQGVASAAPAVVQNAAPAAATQSGLNGLLGSVGQTGKTVINASGLGGQMKDILNAETAYTTIKDPSMSLHDKFNKLAPMAYEQAEKGKGQFAQLQQGANPQYSNMQQLPSYAQPSTPYMGGGIEEILARQRGLLR